MSLWYCVRDKAKSDRRPWKGAWIKNMDEIDNDVWFQHQFGNVAEGHQFRSLKEAEMFVFNLTTREPEYIGRLVIHPIDWGTSGHRLIIDKAVY